VSAPFLSVIPVLRIFDVDVAKRFYVDYLGCTVDWVAGDPDGPVYLQVSRPPLVLQLSSHHGDGTPGSVVLIEVTDIRSLVDELHGRDYPFMNPGVDEGPLEGMLNTELIDPFSNRIRFLQRNARD
jgi:hypothetical protein